MDLAKDEAGRDIPVDIDRSDANGLSVCVPFRAALDVAAAYFPGVPALSSATSYRASPTHPILWLKNMICVRVDDLKVLPPGSGSCLYETSVEAAGAGTRATGIRNYGYFTRTNLNSNLHDQVLKFKLHCNEEV
ncbi:hypothetical protein FA95DRAFT_1209134 [Auriscalpium vulgare]|uniref:Uncharacterized protein n=1 Tax=Auriscalpium vulgare TaxID=40419 RepID=A0ACB8RVF5_9AGAM|nr:hypothetical protein FA95DRAFT_1209134 [Auriscalpium vulgare]